MKNILVTGANGQLGNELRLLSEQLVGWNWVFTDVADLDITHRLRVREIFEKYNFEICVNAAAYTAVDKAESEPELAQKINADAVRLLGDECQKYDTLFFQISTDFIFDGKRSTPYFENDEANPLSIYGITKKMGEHFALLHPKTFVLRTSWLYSTFGHNFPKTMLRLAENRKSLRIISDQIGTPTYARDLAICIIEIIRKVQNNLHFQDYGIYHFSNEGIASWYDFAEAVFEYKNIDIEVLPIPTHAYPTPAQRPPFSVMDKQKIKTTFGIQIPHWRKSLRQMLF